MVMILNGYSLQLLIVLLVTITTAYGKPVCNKTASTGNLSFYNTQENTSVVVGKYFYISCCAQLYDTIKWYHNKIDLLNPIGQNYTKPENCSYCFSQHEYRFAEGGQVLKVYDSALSHAGMYFCIITNGSVTRTFKQTVEVKLRNPQNNSVIDIPEKLDLRCKQNVKATIGANVTLCCVFHGIKPENMDIVWETRTGHNRSLYLEAGDIATLGDTTFVAKKLSVVDITQANTIWYEVTSFLTVYNLTRETYGTYLATSLPKQYNRQRGNCTITVSPETDAESKLVTVVVTMLTSFILVICLMTILVSLYIWKRYHMTIWLFVSDLSSSNDDMEEAIYDAFISHSNTDEDRLFAVQVLRPLLERHNYTTCIDVVNFPAGGIRFDDGIAAVTGSRRCIIVLSPDYINNVHCRYELDSALEQMKKLRARCLKIIPIIFKYTSKQNLNKSKHLDRVLVAVRKLKWTPDNVQHFEQKLVSRMGPMRIKQVHNNEDTFSDDRHTTGRYNFNTGTKSSFNRFYNPGNVPLNNIPSDLSDVE